MKGSRHLALAVLFSSLSSFAQPDRSGFSAPIIVDTKGVGFHFTDPAKGDYVSFDLKGDGRLMKVSWPQAGSETCGWSLSIPAARSPTGAVVHKSLASQRC